MHDDDGDGALDRREVMALVDSLLWLFCGDQYAMQVKSLDTTAYRPPAPHERVMNALMNFVRQLDGVEANVTLQTGWIVDDAFLALTRRVMGLSPTVRISFNDFLVLVLSEPFLLEFFERRHEI